MKTKHPYFKEVEYKKSGATKKKKHYEVHNFQENVQYARLHIFKYLFSNFQDQVKNNTQIDGITIKQTPQTVKIRVKT